MYKGLLRTLTYMYQFITLGRGTLTIPEMEGMAATAGTLTGRAPEVLDPEDGGSLQENKLTLEQAQIVDQHIEEMVVWITHQEII